MVHEELYISDAGAGKLRLAGKFMSSNELTLFFFFAQYSCTDCISEQIALLKKKKVIDKVILVSDFSNRKELRYLKGKFGVKNIYRLGNSILGQTLRSYPFYYIVEDNRGYNSFIPEKSDISTSENFIDSFLQK